MFMDKFRVYVLEQCNSIWVQNLICATNHATCVLEQCNSIWVQNSYVRI